MNKLGDELTHHRIEVFATRPPCRSSREKRDHEGRDRGGCGSRCGGAWKTPLRVGAWRAEWAIRAQSVVLLGA